MRIELRWLNPEGMFTVGAAQEVPASVDGVSLESLVRHCQSRGLSRYKHPERLVLVDALPRNLVGKVIKRDLRQAFG